MPMEAINTSMVSHKTIKHFLIACILVLGNGNGFSEGPCNSKVYLELNAKDPDSLSRREFIYLTKHKRWCAEANQVQEQKTNHQESLIGIAFGPIQVCLFAAALIFLTGFRF